MNLRAIVDPTTRENYSDLGHFEFTVGKFSFGSEKSGGQYQGPGPQAAGIGTELHSAQHLDNVTVMHVKVHHGKVHLVKVHHGKVHLDKMTVSHVKVHHDKVHLGKMAVSHVEVHHGKVHLGKVTVSHVKVLGPSLKRS